MRNENILHTAGGKRIKGLQVGVPGRDVQS